MSPEDTDTVRPTCTLIPLSPEIQRKESHACKEVFVAGAVVAHGVTYTGKNERTKLGPASCPQKGSVAVATRRLGTGQVCRARYHVLVRGSPPSPRSGQMLSGCWQGERGLSSGKAGARLQAVRSHLSAQTGALDEDRGAGQTRAVLVETDVTLDRR